MRRIVLFTAAVIMSFSMMACSKSTDTADKTDNKTTNATIATPVVTGDNLVGDADTSTEEDTTIDSGAKTDKPSPTLMVEQNQDADDEEDTNEEDEDTSSDTTSVEELLENDDYQKEMEQTRQQAWKQTFLVWVPEFESGAFSGTMAEGTFDYAVFTVVGGQNVIDAYVETLVANGFTGAVDFGEVDGKYWYYATNSEGWSVTVDYEAETDAVRVGSGFMAPVEDDNEEQINKTWSSSVLMMCLPVFTEGTFELYNEDNTDGNSAYAVFSDVLEDDAREYVLLLAETGFVNDVEQGDTDGVIWYIATDEGGITCDFQYSDGICKVGCGAYNN